MSMSGEVLSGTVAKAILAVAGLAGGIYFARVLGPAAFGSAYLLLSIAHTIDRPVDGVARAAKQRIAAADAPPGELLGAQFLTTGAWVASLAVAVYAAGDLLASYTGFGAAVPFLLAILATESVFAAVRPLLQGRGRVGASLWVEAGVKVLAIAMQVVLIHFGYGVAGWVAGLAIANLVGLPVMVCLIGTAPRRPSVGALRSLWGFAKYSAPTAVTGKFYSRLDMFLIAAVLAPAVVGYYEAAFKLTFVATMLSNIVSSSLMPKVGALASEGDLGLVSQNIRNARSFSSIIGIPIVFGSLAIGPELVRVVYGPEYGPAALLLVVIGVAKVLETQAGPLISALNGLDRPAAVLKMTLAAMFANVVVGLPLLVAFGAAGIVVGSMAAEMVKIAWCKYTLPDLPGGVTPHWRLLTVQLAGGAGCAGVAYAVVHAAPVPIWVAVLLAMASGGAVYAGALVGGSPKVRRIAVDQSPLKWDTA